MSPVQFVVAALGTAPVRSLTMQAGRSIVAALLNDRSSLVDGRSERQVCACRPKRRAVGERQAKHVVPGCVRVSVPGLWGDPEWAGELESRLLQLPGIRDVQASSRTGRMLVLFDPAVIAYEEIDQALGHDPVDVHVVNQTADDDSVDGLVHLPIPLGQGEQVIDLAVQASR